MAKHMIPLVRDGGFYASNAWTPLVMDGGTPESISVTANVSPIQLSAEYAILSEAG